MSERQVVGLGVLGMLLISAIDMAIGYKVSLIVVHLLPVLLVTWFASPRWGFFLLVVMTVIGVLGQNWLAPPSVPMFYRYLERGSDFVAISILILVQARLRQAYRNARRQARIDALTGCLNRSSFHQQLQDEVARQKRYGRVHSLLYLDVDEFRTVNETLGHQAGDVLLAEVGRALRARVRRTDSVGRMGADEFALLLRETDQAAAMSIAAEIKQDLERIARGYRWPVCFSIGIVCFSRPPSDADVALRLAEELMNEAKQRGKDALCSRVV